MSQLEGRCPACDRDGNIGEPCPEKACSKRDYHYIPVVFWDRAHRDSETPPDPMIGSLVGDFLIVDAIGAGGFGRVFLALQSPLFRLRGALKLIEFPSDNAVIVQALSEKFQGEAEALAELTHPNIVRLLKYGMHGKKPYLVMEYVDNAATLRHEILVRAKRQTGFTHKQLKIVFDQILNGLEAAHAQNIIHRDVKPENVMLQEVVGNPMHVKLLDFGTAKFIENRADTKWPLGSPSYMAPEQVNLKGIGPWSDLYAVGVMIFELLTGHRPFPGKTENEIVSFKMDETFDPLKPLEAADFPADVQSFMRKALDRSPEDRYRSVEEFRASMHIAFEQLAEHPGTYGSQGVELTNLLDDSDLVMIAAAGAQPTRQASDPPEGIIATDEKSEPPALPSKLHLKPTETSDEAEDGDEHSRATAVNAAIKLEDLPDAQASDDEPEQEKAAQGDNHRRKSSSAPMIGLLAVVAVLGLAVLYLLNEAPAPPVEQIPDAGAAKTPDLATVAVPDLGKADAGSKADIGGAPDAGASIDFGMADAPQQIMKLQGVSAGKFHTCAVIEGNVRCWGANFEGELGLGNKNAVGDKGPASKAPYVKLDGKALQVVAAGDRQSNYSCALLEGGDVRCWGANQFGQLGLGNTDRVGQENTPTDVPPLGLGGAATFISAGASQFASHACAILEGGLLRCWGGNKYGELGLAHTTTVGDDEPPSALAPVQLPEKTAHVSSGKYHTCVVSEKGTVRCWGWNKYGQLGLGHTKNIGDDEVPGRAAKVALPGKATQTSVGRWHSCALLENGDVHCWGRNNKGQLGLGNTKDIGDNEKLRKSKAVDLGAPAIGIALGSLHTCALLEDGRVRCWGDNKFGQLGYSHTRDVGDDESPMTVAAVYMGEKAVALTAGAYHNCAILESDQLKCWGYNKFGQLGYGHTKNIGDTETPAAAGNVPVFSKD